MIDEKTLQNVLRGFGIQDQNVTEAMPILLGKMEFKLCSQAPVLLNMIQVRASLGGVSRWTVTRAMQSGKLKSIRIGRRVMFSPLDVDAFVKTQRVRNFKASNCAA